MTSADNHRDPQIEIDVRAKMMLKQDEKIRTLEKQADEFRADGWELLEVIAVLQAADKNRPDCAHCIDGYEVIEVDDPGGPGDLDQPSHMERVECDACRTTGKDWDWTPGEAS